MSLQLYSFVIFFFQLENCVFWTIYKTLVFFVDETLMTSLSTLHMKVNIARLLRALLNQSNSRLTNITLFLQLTGRELG